MLMMRSKHVFKGIGWAGSLAVWCLLVWVQSAAAAPGRNIVFILVDDMRYDAMSCAGHPFLETPAIDALAENGVRFDNAFVTTSLCSPSRASFLTGLYAHNHGVMNNHTRLDPSLATFPRLLQGAGYKTAFIGKWHMGGSSNAPRPGFDYWASFRGQGRYHENDFNINGQHEHIEEYVTDTVTRLGLDFVRANRDQPFMVYMSHKAVHGDYDPAPRHRGKYSDAKIEFPASMAYTPENYYRKPRWVLRQRGSYHGVDDVYFGRMSLKDAILDYNRCMLGIEDSVAEVVATLKELGLYESTLIVLAGDNGFMFGEHGMIDKRCMYEESIRVPMVMSCPELFGTAGKRVKKMVLNIDVAPTFLEAAGVEVPEAMQGMSFLRLAEQPEMAWRDAFLYEYLWEPPYPETPSMFGIRTDQHKYVQYHGVWDTNELYDLAKDPDELHNRLSTSRRKKVTVDPGYEKTYRDLRTRLQKLIADTGARSMPSWKQ